MKIQIQSRISTKLTRATPGWGRSTGPVARAGCTRIVYIIYSDFNSVIPLMTQSPDFITSSAHPLEGSVLSRCAEEIANPRQRNMGMLKPMQLQVLKAKIWR